MKSTIEHYQLQTNLINGGNGRIIFEKPLLDLIDHHVGIGWSKTHFLSFSEKETTAYRFGIGCQIEELENKILNYTHYFDQNTNWDFAIIVLGTKNIKFNEINNGVYEALYLPTLTKFKYLRYYKAIFINVSKALTNHARYIESYNNSIRDREWLVLPATKILLNSNISEYSGILDGGCISEIKKFKLES